MNDEQWSETGEDWLSENQGGYIAPGGTPMVTSWHCGECGTWSSNGTVEEHECEPAILVAYQLEVFDQQFEWFMNSRRGRFARFVAEREVNCEHSVEEW